MDTVMSKGLIIKRENVFKIIGKWYKNFIVSNETSLSLQMPSFQEDEVNVICEYILNFDLLLKILAREKIGNYNGTALFDIFNYAWSDSFRKKSNPIHLDFQKKINKTLYFADDTVISEERFTPVFISSQINNSAVNDAIYDGFFLFRVLAQANIIYHPILIDLESDLSLFVSKPMLLKNSKLLVKSVAGNELKDNSQLHNFLTLISDLRINTSISYRFPYNSAIDSRVYKSLKDDTKRFELILRKRFYYDEIKNNDVVITPNELNSDSTDILDFLKCFGIINTTHDIDLYNSLIELKEFWRTSNFNPYRVPFPAKWFTCINVSENLSFWHDQYKKDFPSVKHATLALVQNIIDAAYKLNWIDEALNSIINADIIVPQSNLYPTVSNSLSEYLRAKDHHVIDFETITTDMKLDNRSITILDSFNTVMLTNVSHLHNKYNMQIISPDFIYYNCQPFVKYQIANYSYEALTRGSRKSMDPSHESMLQMAGSEKSTILKDIKNELAQYQRRFDQAPKEITDNDLRFTQDDSTSPLMESEVVELLDNKQYYSKSTNPNILKVSTVNEEFLLKPNAKVLIEEKGYIVSSIALVLTPGMRFLPISVISKTIEESKIVDRMASMPETALNWKYQLYTKSKIHTKLYETLKNRDLSIQESTFNKDYLNQQPIEVNEFHLPRSYHDWEIICEYLNISEVEESWTCHKCYGNIAALKNAYANVIAFLNEEGNYGANIDDRVIAKVASIFDSIKEIKEDRLKLARSIIKSITNKLELQEIMSIQTLPYE